MKSYLEDAQELLLSVQTTRTNAESLLRQAEEILEDTKRHQDSIQDRTVILVAIIVAEWIAILFLAGRLA